MADQNNGDKSEQPSEHKLRKAREQGQVARSRDLAAAVGLIAAIQVTAWLMPSHIEHFRLLFARGLSDMSGSGSIEHVWSTVWSEAWWLLLSMVAPLFIVPALVVLASLFPGGWAATSKNLVPKLSRLSPIANLGRLFSAKHYSDLAMSIVKAGAIAAVLYLFCASSVRQFLGLQSMPMHEAIGAGVALVLQGVMALVAVFVVLALIDVPLQRFLFRKGQRMSKQEVKEEHKNIEGRPEVKQRIRQIQRQLSRRGIRASVPTADVVIVNPEHYSVALRYDPERAEAPFVVAKGVDEMALYIREVARSHRVEIVPLPPLARAIYNTSQVNQQIPAALYGAVAQTLNYVLQIKAFRNGARPAPPSLPSEIEVPAHLSETAQP